MKTLRSLYWESTRSARFITIVVSALGAIGVFLRRDSANGDMGMVFELFPWWVWSMSLLIVSTHRYWCLWRSAICGPDCLETKPGVLVSVIAIFVWAVFLTSSAASSDFGLALMLLVCIGLECWLLSRHIQQLTARREKML